MDGQTIADTQSANVEVLPGTEVCSVTIMFVVESDLEAMAVKHRLREAVVGVKNVRMQFIMTNAPKRPTQDL